MDSDKRYSQDEIISNTKNVMRGLETLKSEHDTLLENLLHKSTDTNTTEGKENDERTQSIRRSLEQIELGLGEAQVRILIF